MRILRCILLALGGVALAGCRGSTQKDPSVSSATTPASSKRTVVAGSASAPRPDAASDAGAVAPADAMLGRFVPRIEVIPSEEDDFECVPYISSLAGLPSGDVWVVGGCGLRGRLSEEGFADLGAPWQKKGSSYVNQYYSCPAHAYYYAALARSPEDVYAVGDTRCGLDPSSIWFRAPERFDGRAWRSLVHQGQRRVPEVLAAGTSGPVYGLVGRSRDDVRSAPSACAITSLHAGQSRILRQCRAPRHSAADGSGDVERFASIGVSASGALWVSGERITWQNSVEKSTPFLLRHERGRWTEQAFEDVGELVTAASGELWMFGAAAWQEQQGTWRKVPLRADLREASEVRVRAPDDVWWLGETDVWHFDGEHTRRVALERPDERSSVMRLALAGPNLYVSSQFKVWQLVAPARPAPNVITLHLGRAPAEFR